MSLRLVSVGVQRGTPKKLYVQLQNPQGESVSVYVPLEAHVEPESLTIGEIEHLAHQAAKQLHP
ncbi:hypothetical protein AB4Y42_34490 [Paraburkholderia sp. EG286B]|uniref:hypothetical protein n=1 Tax=Paraburkholderia sp. EG286B TaxID=3237011 RepID=UPI0034D21008